MILLRRKRKLRVSKMFLVGMLSSVIQDPLRLRYFRLLLDSVRNQQQPLDGFFVSIYVAPELEVDLTVLLRGIPNCRVLKHKSPKLQFVQIQHMADRLDQYFPCPLNKKRFIMFSDDDDLWNSDRVSAYRITTEYAFENVPNEMAFVSSVCSRAQTVHNVISCDKLHKDESNVDDYLSCGCIKFQEIPKDEIPEYHNYVVCDFVLTEFLKENKVMVQTNHYCDMHFGYFLCSYKAGLYRTLHVGYQFENDWLYFYRSGPSSYLTASRFVKTTPGVSLEISKEHEKTRIYIRRYLEMLDVPRMHIRAEKELEKFERSVPRENWKLYTRLKKETQHQYEQEKTQFI